MPSALTETQVLKILESYDNDKQQLIAALLDIQAASGDNHVAEEWAALTAKTLDVPLSKVYDVLTFYAMFSTNPRGEFVIEICKSTPCHISKADEIVDWFENELGVKLGETTPDKKFTLFHTSCVGACDVGPVAKIGDEVYGNLSRQKVSEIVKRYREGR